MTHFITEERDCHATILEPRPHYLLFILYNLQQKSQLIN